MTFEPKSFEQAVEHMTRQIREQHYKIIDDFYKAYAAQLCHLENFCLDDICLIEQEPHYREGCVTRRYWFEYKPKFNEENQSVTK